MKDKKMLMVIPKSANDVEAPTTEHRRGMNVGSKTEVPFNIRHMEVEQPLKRQNPPNPLLFPCNLAFNWMKNLGKNSS